jgi:hypothetical protein
VENFWPGETELACHFGVRPLPMYAQTINADFTTSTFAYDSRGRRML